MDLHLTGRTALVTGSYRGTGAGIATVLAAEGAHVLVHGFEDGQPDSVVASITAAGGSASPLVADITSDASGAVLSEAAADVDVLVNNYGTPKGSSWSSLDTWFDEWNENVLTGVRTTQAAMGGMRDRGWGRIIFIGTIGTQRPGTRNPGYYGAKTAIPTLVQTLAQELRGTGVTTNLVSPGMIATAEMQAAVMRGATRAGAGDTWEQAQRWALDNTMPNLSDRIPYPEDIGRIVAFVASEAAWHINGADIAANGGLV